MESFIEATAPTRSGTSNHFAIFPAPDIAVCGNTIEIGYIKRVNSLPKAFTLKEEVKLPARIFPKLRLG